MSIRTFLLGKRLATDEEREEQIGPLAGIPLLGLDALASAAYGPEAALTVLIPLGAAANHYIIPVSLALVALLSIVYFSYRQTIDAYPNGGGSYTVARENLGTSAGLLAAAALMLDYMLNVAVAVSAGVGALVSAAPALLPHTLPLCLAILALLTLVNLRGPRSSGMAFSAPTYLFLASLFAVIAIGLFQVIAHHGEPTPVAPPPAPAAATGTVSLWLLLRSFANGCTAMTGVEAVSNGVPAFRAPNTVLARRTLSLIVAALVLLLAGVAVLARAYGITATAPGEAGYDSILSQIIAAVVGRGALYHVTIAAVVSVLCLSANTSFADFPRLCRILAADRFLPEPFIHRGRRLAFSVGIVALAVCAAALLIAFRGLTEGLIPLFAVGALLAFTMSQAGMVEHWRRAKRAGEHRHAPRAAAINALGAIATLTTVVIVIASKLREGAWISLLLIAATITLFSRVRRHYRAIDAATGTREPLRLDPAEPPIAIVAMRRWDRVARDALRFAYTLTDEVIALHVRTDDEPRDDLTEDWQRLAGDPVAATGRRPPRLTVFRSRYRKLLRPLLGFVTKVANASPGRRVAVIVPELVEPRWYHYLLHNHTAALLRWLVLGRGLKGIVIISLPWYFREQADGAGGDDG